MIGWHPPCHVQVDLTLIFKNLFGASLPPVLLRDLSAPVKLRYKYSDEDLAFLMKHDTDSFNRWEAGQQVGGVRVRIELLFEVLGRSSNWTSGSMQTDIGSPSALSSKQAPSAAERLLSVGVDVVTKRWDRLGEPPQACFVLCIAAERLSCRHFAARD